MNNFILVGVGGMLGSVARYSTSAIFLRLFPAVAFPWATFLINLTGCLLIGIASVVIERLTNLNAELRLLSITGFLGGFTTFSAFGAESLHLLRTGQLLAAILYCLGSVFLGVFCVWLGFKLGGMFS